MPFPQMTEDTRKAMKLNSIEGAFAVSSDHLAVPFLGLFALALGATPSQIGMLSAFPALFGNILQIPYGILAERIGKRRLLCLIGGVWLRGSWLLIAFVPFLVGEEWRIPAVIALATLRIALGNLGAPAWIAIQADIIPKQIRGKYFANRNILMNVCALGATLLAGRIIGLSFPGNYQTLLVLAVIFGVLSSISFGMISIPDSPRKESKGTKVPFIAGIKAFVKVVRESRNFARYCISALVWNFGVTLAGSLLSIYFVRGLGGKPGSWALVTAMSIVAGIACQRHWGRLADKFGQKNVMSIAGLGVVLIPFLWFSIPHSGFAIFVNFWGGLMWSGYNLAAFNMILEITPEENRTMYIGVFNTLLGLATALGPLTGGFLAEMFGLRMIFLISFFLRGLGLFLFNRNVDNASDKRLRFGDLMPAPIRQMMRVRG